MRALIVWMWRRFTRLWLWLPVLFLPLVLFLSVFFFGEESEPPLAFFLLGDLFLYGLPPLAIVFSMTAVDPRRWDLILTRPIGFPRFLFGQWMGALLPFAVSAVVLLFVAGLVGVFGAASQTSARDFHRGVSFYRGTPEAPFPLGDREGRQERRDWLTDPAPWTFELEGLRPGQDLDAEIVAEIGEVSGKTIYQALRAPARVRFLDARGENVVEPLQVELRYQRAVPITIPAVAIAADGRLRLSVELERSSLELEGVLMKDAHDHDAHDGHDHAAEDPGDVEPLAAAGQLAFWFRRAPSVPGRATDDGVWRPELDRNGQPATGLRVVRHEHGFAENFFRTGLLAMGLLPLVVGMATFASAIFGRAVAFAFNVTIFLCGILMTFLREIVGALSLGSSILILGDPNAPQILRQPTWFDLALEKWLRFWITVLPDFEVFRGGEFLVRGELVRWSTVVESLSWGLLYAAGFLLLGVLSLSRWELRR